MSRTICSLIVIALTAHASDAQTDKVRWISATDNISHAEAVILGKDLTPDCETPWSVRLKTLHGGKQQGSQLLTLDNGRMQIVLIPTRGMGILSVTWGDLKLGWKSPVHEVVHP